MARQAIYYGQLTDDIMNSGKPYRVRLSYGVFSLSPKVTQSGTYYSAYKRAGGKLFKQYVGGCGDVTADAIYKATMALSDKIRRETGLMFARSNRGRE
jgi:hypothetical protein